MGLLNKNKSIKVRLVYFYISSAFSAHKTLNKQYISHLINIIITAMWEILFNITQFSTFNLFFIKYYIFFITFDAIFYFMSKMMWTIILPLFASKCLALYTFSMGSIRTGFAVEVNLQIELKSCWNAKRFSVMNSIFLNSLIWRKRDSNRNALKHVRLFSCCLKVFWRILFTRLVTHFQMSEEKNNIAIIRSLTHTHTLINSSGLLLKKCFFFSFSINSPVIVLLG